jgi:hypothetical protein
LRNSSSIKHEIPNHTRISHLTYYIYKYEFNRKGDDILILNKLFGSLEKKTGVKVTEVMKLAQSLQNSNFKDEKTVRSVIHQVSSLAKKPVPKKQKK